MAALLLQCKLRSFTTRRNTVRPVDLTGQTFNRLTALTPTSERYAKSVVWSCVCTCGTHIAVAAFRLKSGNVQSCGCLQAEVQRYVTHGHTVKGRVSKTYAAWSAMMQRCYTPTHPAFDNYGGRGIRVVKRWWTFKNFLADMGKCPPRLSLERIDNEKGYSKRNCKWATTAEQNRNRRMPWRKK